MIIDTHVHIFTFPCFENLGDKIQTKRDLVNFRSRYPEIFKRRTIEHHLDNTDTLVAHMDRRQISFSIVQQTVGQIPNEDVCAAARRHPTRLFSLATVGRETAATGYPEDPSPALHRAPDIVAHGFEELGMVGIGELMVRGLTNKIHPEEIARDLEPLMKVLARYRRPLQIPTAWTIFRGGLIYGSPFWVDELAGRHPEVPIVLTKMGRGISYYFDMAMTVALRNENIYFDTVQTSSEHLRIAVDELGADRIMFGTDWSQLDRWVREPGDVYQNALAILDKARLTPDERETILWKTAAKVFRLDMQSNPLVENNV